MILIGFVLWRHLVSACEVKAHLIGCWQYLGAVCFWQPSFGLNLVVVAVLRDRLLWGWAFCLNYNKRGCYFMLCYESRRRFDPNLMRFNSGRVRFDTYL